MEALVTIWVYVIQIAKGYTVGMLVFTFMCFSASSFSEIFNIKLLWCWSVFFLQVIRSSVSVCPSVCLFTVFLRISFTFFWFFIWSQCSDFEGLMLKWLDFWGTFFIERIVSKKYLIWLWYVLLKLFANFVTRLLCNWPKMKVVLVHY